MTKTSGSIADPPAAAGEDDGVPHRQVDAGNPQAGDDNGPPIEIPEPDRRRILDAFVGEEDADPPPADDDEHRDPSDHDTIDWMSMDDKGGKDGDDADDPDRAGSDGDHRKSDDDAFADSELDQIAKRLEREEQGKAFAFLRRKAKDAERMRDAAELGVRFNTMLENSGLDQEGIADLVDLLGTIKRDPLRAIDSLRSRLRDAATAARERYPDLDLGKMLEFKIDAKPTEPQLPKDLEDAVESGQMTRERALALAKLEREAEDRSTAKRDGNAFSPEVVESYRDNTRAILKEIGFYRTPREADAAKRKQILDDRIDKHLIPEMERIAERDGIDLTKCHPKQRQEVTIRAAKAVLAKIERGKSGNHSLRKGDGRHAPERDSRGPEDERAFRSRVIRSFR